MILPLIDVLKSRLKDTKYFREVHGIAQMVSETRTDTGATKSYPAVYIGSDSLKFVTQYDFSNGFCYFLTSGKSVEQSETKRANQFLFRELYDITLYGITRRPDNQFDLVTAVQRALEINNEKDIRQTTGAIAVISFVTDVNTVKEEVLPDMFTNIDIKARQDLSYIRMELQMEVIYQSNCIKNVCC